MEWTTTSYINLEAEAWKKKKQLTIVCVIRLMIVPIYQILDRWIKTEDRKKLKSERLH